MKRLTFFLLALIAFFLYSCSGSDTYRGLWKATDLKGQKLELTFDAKTLLIKDETGATSNFDYTQNSVSIENSVETYGIKLSDGRTYLINFPIANDETKGIIKDGNGGNLLYTISKTDYITYDDLYKLK